MELLSKATCVNVRSWMREHAQQLMLVVSLTVITLLNYHLLFTFFHEDDFYHLYQIANGKPLEFIFYPIGGHLYIFRNVIFYCMFKLVGLKPIAFFSIALVTHLLNAFILYKIIQLLTGKTLLASVGTMMWGVSPINYSTIGWYSAYGHLLVVLFFLLFLYDLLKYEKDNKTYSMSIAIRWTIYLLLAACSYGPGVILALLAPITIAIILWKNDSKWRIALSASPVFVMVLLLIIFNNHIYRIFSGELSPYAQHVEIGNAIKHYKAITELSAWMYINSVFWLNALPLLFGLPIMFLKNQYRMPGEIIEYTECGIAISITVLLMVLIVRSNGERFRRYVVFCFLAVGIIGLIACARAPGAAEQHFPIVLLSYTKHWYYALMVLFILIMVLMADQVLEAFPRITKVIGAYVSIVIVIIIYISLGYSKIVHNDPVMTKAKKTYYDTVNDIKKKIRSYPEGSTVYIDNKMKKRLDFIFPDADFPGKAAVFAITYPTNTVEGRRVFFVENDCNIADRSLAKKDWRISSLMVSDCKKKRHSKKSRN
jgi:hypothetical protein